LERSEPTLVVGGGLRLLGTLGCDMFWCVSDVRSQVMSFDRELEGEYVESRLPEIWLISRWYFAVGGVIFLVLAFWDDLIDPGSVAETWPLRVGAAVFFFALIALSWRARSVLALEALVVVALAAAAIGFGLIVAVVDSGYLAGVGGFLVAAGSITLAIRTRGAILYLAALVVAPILVYVITGASRTETGNLLVWLLGSASFAYVGFVVLDSTNRRAFVAEKALVEERDKVDRLVRKMVPEPIADRLKAGDERISDRLEDVTVLFADIVGFTGFAERRSPEDVVRLLNTIFGSFDALVAKNGLEKIKTIGDGYMVAGGAPVERAGHATAAARLALDMRSDIARISAEHDGDWRIRIGIHTGPVVAGVIGEDRYAYDLWGDTVNLASRLESTGDPGDIRLSQYTASRLEEIFEVESLGSIEIKNREPVIAYRLTGTRT
jgi:class 3 adenylate cyclase